MVKRKVSIEKTQFTKYLLKRLENLFIYSKIPVTEWIYQVNKTSHLNVSNQVPVPQACQELSGGLKPHKVDNELAITSINKDAYFYCSLTNSLTFWKLQYQFILIN